MTSRRLLPALLLSAGCSAAWAQNPAGAEFQVNSYTAGGQRLPAVSSDAIGNFVVVWESYGQDGSGYGVFGQRLNAAGLPQGSEFQVNSYTTYNQYRPAVTSDANGNFVVVWESYGQEGEFAGAGVFGQRFDASGLPQGSEFQINSYTTNSQHVPAVAADAGGGFVVVWTSADSTLPIGGGQDGSGSGVFGQRFNALGVPQGGEFRVNSYTYDNQGGAKVASDANGNFVVVWHSVAQEGSGWGVFGERFNALGVPQGSEFRVNAYTTGHQFSPTVASDANGNFVVVWNSWGQDGSYGGVFGQLFNPAGLPQGAEFQVNSYTTGHQFSPTVASDADGNFVVVWTSDGQEGSSYGYGVFGQRFNASGVRQGSEFHVNSYTTDDQWYPAVASDAKGNFVVAWHSVGQDGSFYGVFGQRFGDLVFKNGFE